MQESRRYEIFQKLSSKEPTWVGTATVLEDALNRLKELARLSPADYFILERGKIKFITQFE